MAVTGIGAGYVTDYIHTYKKTKMEEQKSWETGESTCIKKNDCANAGNSNQMVNGISLNEAMEKFSFRFVTFDNTALENSSEEESTACAEETETDYEQFIQEYIQKLYVKIENGDTEVSYQIGKSSFTQKEWDELLEKFDSAEDTIRKLVEEEIEKRIKEKQDEIDTVDKTKASDDVSEAQMDMLVSETIQARFPMQDVDEEGKCKEDLYLIAIDENGIRCLKSGQEEYVWEILFTDETQYEKAVEFLNDTGQCMDNFLFAAHENFWEDYFNGIIDVDSFQEFLEGTNNGIPDYSLTVGDSMYIDEEKIQWAQYMNPLGAKFYTAEEMEQMQAELIEKVTLRKLV